MNNEVTVDVQEFGGEKYFLFDKLLVNDINYDLYAQINDPKIIIVVKNIIENNEEFYEIVEEDEYINIMSEYYKKKNE